MLSLKDWIRAVAGMTHRPDEDLRWYVTMGVEAYLFNKAANEGEGERIKPAQ